MGCRCSSDEAPEGVITDVPAESEDFSEESEGEVPAGYTTLYHYTDVDGVIGVLSNKKILKSTASTDAIYGEGIYLTARTPVKGKCNIPTNIRTDNLHDEMVGLGLIDFEIEVVIKRNQVLLKVHNLQILYEVS